MAYRAAIRSDLRNLVEAQDDVFDRTLRYTADTAELPFRPSTGVSVAIVATDSGWSAVGTHASVADGRCGIYDGVGSNPVQDTVPAVPVCVGEGFERRRSPLRRLLRL